MSDDDTLSNISWPEYTKEDLQEIDRLCEASRLNSLASIHGASPNILIEIEGAPADGHLAKSGEEGNVVDKSPFALYRKGRRTRCLSVTDIVAPAWCEVQFDYGLRQFRSKPLSERPKSFVTEKGKEICVKTKIAVKNEAVLEKGRTVHQKLEREIHKEEVPIKVKGREEIWASRLLDFLVRLKSMKTTSVCRELPVWGIIHDEPILGVIDELRLESTNSRNQASTSQTQQSQKNLDPFILNARKIIHAVQSTPRTILHVIDNKTRDSPFLPQHVDTLPSRLQLMLYRLLLIQMLSVSIPGSSSNNMMTYSAFCARVGVKSKSLSRTFSEEFTTEMKALVVEHELSLHFLDAKCLEDMDRPYAETIKDMGLDVPTDCWVSDWMKLVYRLRAKEKKKSEKKKLKTTKEETASVSDSKTTSIETPVPAQSKVPVVTEAVDDEDTITKVVTDAHEDVSVKEVTEVGVTGVTIESVGAAPAPSLGKRKRRESRKSLASKATLPSTVKSPADASTLSDSASSDENDTASVDAELESNTSATPSPFILGTKKFRYNEELLNTHVSSILAWWHGKRPARGVSIEDAWRCKTCEYKNGCEWREQKALEVLDKVTTKQKARAS